MTRTYLFPQQRAFFDYYPLNGNDLRDISEKLDVARQTVSGWVGGHSRISAKAFTDVILPMLRMRYPDLDDALVAEVLANANQSAMRRVARVGGRVSAPVQLHPTVVPTAEPTPVADVFAALTTFPSLRIMLAGARLTPSERLQLIRILTGEEE